MPGADKAEHVCLQVDDLDQAEAFYTDVFGLAEVGRRNDTIYLGCGLDESYDLAIRQGKPGVEHVAVRAKNEEEFAECEERIASNGLDFERTDGNEPGQKRGLRVELPSRLPLLPSPITRDCFDPILSFDQRSESVGRRRSVL